MSDEPKAKRCALRVNGLHPHWYMFAIDAGTKTGGMPTGWPTWNNTNRAEHIRAWAPDCNVGLAIAKSGLLLIDTDIKHGALGARTFAELDAKHGWPATLKWFSPSGGWYLVYRQTDRVRHVTGKNVFGAGIDVPGFTPLPGSVVLPAPGVSAGRYRCDDITTPIADAPDWFAGYLKRAQDSDVEQLPEIELDLPANIARAVYYLEHDALPAIQYQGGERRLLLTAGWLKDHGISQLTAVELLSRHYNPRCEPAWEIGDGAVEDRLDVKVENCWQYLTQNVPGSKTPEHDFADELTADEIKYLERRARVDRKHAEERRPGRRVAGATADGFIKTGKTKLLPDGTRVPVMRRLRHGKE